MAWVKDKTYSMTGDQFNREQAIADGYQIVLPEEDEAQLDIDSPEDYQQFKELLEVLKPHLKVLEVRESDSKTPGHKHITIKVDRVLYPIERIMLQACLGSDRKREILSYARVLRGEPDVSCFFEKEGTIVTSEVSLTVDPDVWYCIDEVDYPYRNSWRKGAKWTGDFRKTCAVESWPHWCNVPEGHIGTPCKACGWYEGMTK